MRREANQNLLYRDLANEFTSEFTRLPETLEYLHLRGINIICLEFWANLPSLKKLLLRYRVDRG